MAGFSCKYSDECSGDAEPRPLTFGAEAHIGSHFGDSPRLVVISLDTGGDSEGLAGRQACIERLPTDLDNLNPHMRGTMLTILALLGPRIAGRSPWQFFAMMNAAKCSGSDGKRASVKDSLYQRCRPFAEEELSLLDPEVIVTQGKNAHAVVKPAMMPVPEIDLTKILDVPRAPDDVPMGGWVRAAAKMYVHLTRINGAEVVTLKTPHPSDWRRWPAFEPLALPVSSWLVCQLLRIRNPRGGDSGTSSVTIKRPALAEM